ncbi:DUF1835 domain-containing protein [Psychroflexus tropicus]|uniref:DUF1835 domain-containing protein n=1 Tax=Psychroflexus tropicus TaxID=197345 RepID=UPI0003765286|nr:DUF1835 domain-containing protein [Psychroflexus tropicus]
MKNVYHILNGDSLKESFPNEIDGEIIVARECLVDGDVSSDTLEDLFKKRATFISKVYGDYSIEDYYADSVSEFEKIQNLPNKAEINLWFEDDLFCQVNFWFTVKLIVNYLKPNKVFLIRPVIHTQYGFGGLNELELINAYKQKAQINELDGIASLWNLYQNNDIEEMVEVAKKLGLKYPFIQNAVEAHIDRIPNENSPGRPTATLLDIMNVLGTDSFGAVFKEFNKRESIYGFGDLQVKRLFDEIKNNS